MTMPLLYQLQGADYASLLATDFRVAVIDPDDSGLTAGQVSDLQTSQGKWLYAYTSIGEAESYRDYWQDGWTTSPPDFLLGENAQWEGNFRVEFWDGDWQEIIYDRIDDVIAAGYDGVYLDIVDGYTVDEVIAAYPGTDEALRQEMIAFVQSISAHAKAQNPDFAIIPQNAVGLLGLTEDGADSGPNTAYLDAIDGLGVEDLWYNGDEPSDWTQGDLDYIALAREAGKFVLATSYPTVDAYREAFVADAIAEGLIPFATDRDLTGVIDPVNDTIEAAMAGADITVPWLVGTRASDELFGTGGNDMLDGGGGGGDDDLSGRGGRDELYGEDGADTLWGDAGRGYLDGESGADTLSGGDENDDVEPPRDITPPLVDAPSDAAAAFKAVLVDASTDEALGVIEEGGSVFIGDADTDDLSVLVEAADGRTESIRLEIDGEGRVENMVPYALFGDSADGEGARDLNGGPIGIGERTLTLTAFDADRGAGTAIATQTLTFTVTDQMTQTAGPVTEAPIQQPDDGNEITVTTVRDGVRTFDYAPEASGETAILSDFDLDSTGQERSFDTLRFASNGTDYSASIDAEFFELVRRAQLSQEDEIGASRDGADLIVEIGQGSRLVIEDIAAQLDQTALAAALQGQDFMAA